MKILLVNPLSRLDDAPRHIPFGISILANIAHTMGHQVGILDLNAFRLLNTPEALRKELSDPDWKDVDLLGITGLHSQYKEVTKILPIARKLHPEAIIAGGGGFMTHLPLETMQLNDEFDVGCIGEGEETFKDILDHIDDQRWDKVKGVVYREEGEVVLSEPRPQIKDLDMVPYPKYDLLALEEAYFPNSPIMLSPESMMSRRRMSFVWERGCPRQCRFCSHQGMSRWDDLIIYGKDKVKEMDKEQRVLPARWPTPKYCVENVKYVRFKYGIDFATVLDENMLSNRTWTEEFCNLYMDEGLHEIVPWGSLGDAPSVAAHPEMIRTLREAGCKYISYGFESASDKVLLDDIGKGQTQKMEQAAVNAMVKYGLGPVATFMLGNPHEDVNDILETVHFWVRNKIEVDPFICFPAGTTLKANPSSLRLEEAQVGQKVQTHRNRYMPVLKRFERDYHGNLVVLTAGDLPVRMTPNHPVLAILREPRYKDRRDSHSYPDQTVTECVQKETPEFIRADALRPGDLVVRPVDRTTEDVDEVRLEGQDYNWQRDLTLKVNKDLMRLCGYYLSEGCIAYREGREVGLLFSFHVKEKEYVSDVRAIVGRLLGLESYVYSKEDNAVQVGVWNSWLARWMKLNFGEHAIGKSIPGFVMRLPLSKQAELVKGYFRGDGYTDRMGFEITSVSEGLLRQFRDLLLRFDILGRLTNARGETRTRIQGRIVRFKKTYRLKVTGQYLHRFGEVVGESTVWQRLGKSSLKSGSIIQGDFAYVAVSSVSEERYDGSVYNVSIEDDESYVVERLGIVHNCTPYPGSPYFETYREQILEQYDERLVLRKQHPEIADEATVKKWKMEALNRFLRELDDAYDLTAHVSQVFDYADLLALKSLMKSKDIGRILKLAHMRGWPHQEKWKKWCPVCKASSELSLPAEEDMRSLGPMVVKGNPNVRV